MKKMPLILSGGMGGACIGPLGNAIAEWGKAPVQTQVLRVSIGLALMIASAVLFSIYGSRSVNPDVGDRGLKKLAARYPLLFSFFAVAMGVAAGIAVRFALDL